MCQNILNDPTFILSIIYFDQQLAQQLQSGGCFFCNQPLDAAHYPRKPKGAPTDPKLLREFVMRYSYCCRQCRKRHTPMSIRFLGRRSYLAVTIVLASAMTQGLSDSRIQKLTSLGISRQTLHRWLSWWQDKFILTPVWQAMVAHFYNAAVIPLDPLMALQADNLQQKLLLWLKQLMPLTVDASVLLRVQTNPQNV